MEFASKNVPQSTLGDTVGLTSEFSQACKEDISTLQAFFPKIQQQADFSTA